MFCFIGGLAVNRWGEPRYTQDADATVLTEFVHDEKLVDYLLASFRPRRADARVFALRNRVLLLQDSAGVPLDIALGALDFEQRAIQRASPWYYDEAHEVITCSAEDLVVHKAFAGRDLDWIDVDRILRRQGAKLKGGQVLQELAPLADLKEDRTTLPRLEDMLRKSGAI